MKRNDQLKNFMNWWNINFPIDRWWRNKHKVSFNSSVHREVSFLDQYLEYIEDKMYEKIIEKHERIKNYTPNVNDFMIVKDVEEMDISELKKEAQIAISNFKDFSL